MFPYRFRGNEDPCYVMYYTGLSGLIMFVFYRVDETVEVVQPKEKPQKVSVFQLVCRHTSLHTAHLLSFVGTRLFLFHQLVCKDTAASMHYTCCCLNRRKLYSSSIYSVENCMYFVKSSKYYKKEHHRKALNLS